MNTQPAIATTELYEQDFCLWVEATLEILRTRQLDRLDVENLIEEIEGMSSREKHALESNLEIVQCTYGNISINQTSDRIAGDSPYSQSN